ncbi:DUF4150 domain-containing protein [Agrobacterium vitis]
MSDDNPLVINIVGGGRYVDTQAMSPAELGAYNAALDKGNSLYSSDLEGAKQAWAEADRIAAPYIKERKRPPRPAAPSPAPPEIIPDNRKAIAVCLSPDVCKSPDDAVPYMSWGTADNDYNYSPNVRANGEVIKRFDSKFTTTYGDEPGTGLGVKSGTVGDVVEPVTSSPIVNVNGIPIQRHADRCTLNNGNTEGEYCYVNSTETQKAPDATDNQNKSVVAQGKAELGHFWEGMKATSDEASLIDGAAGKISDYYNGKASVWGDVKGAYESLPTGAQIWQSTQDVGSGLYNVGEHVVNDPVGSAKAAGGFVVDGVKGAVNSVEEGYDKHGMSGALGAGTGVLASIVSPGKKIKLLKEVEEGLEEAGKIGKIARERQHVEKAEHAAEAVEGSGGGRVTNKKKPTRNPCLHLAKGDKDGPGEFRGGSYGGTKGVGDKNMESNHMPPKSVSPLGELPSPSMQMDKADHRDALSTGSSAEAKEWRKAQQELIDAGQYRDALAMDIRDVRRIAQEGGDIRKYNQATRELLAYYKCLQEHGWLPGKK